VIREGKKKMESRLKSCQEFGSHLGRGRFRLLGDVTSRTSSQWMKVSGRLPSLGSAVAGVCVGSAQLWALWENEKAGE
jgi:hypothetical protein